MTKEAMEREIVELGQQVGTLTQVLLALVHRFADVAQCLAEVDEILAADIVSDLELLQPIQEGAGEELLREPLQALSQLGHDVPAEAGGQTQ
ncbi:MAG: hypothetical protein OXN97_07710 [Bryobacterales bacterium]|nr:hypothetical protein [Bryobacterales bacterium]